MGNYFRPSAPFTGGTVSGDTYFLQNLSARTYYSASTPLDIIIDNIASKFSNQVFIEVQETPVLFQTIQQPIFVQILPQNE